MSQVSNRRGAVTVEFALTAPILFALVMGSVEFSRANMLVNTAGLAATEGARAGIVPGATASEVRAAAKRELDILGVRDSTITVEPAVITADTPIVAVGVQVPVTARNGYMIPKFFLGKTVTKVAALRREPAVNATPQQQSALAAIIERLRQLLSGGNSGSGNSGS